MQGCFHVGRKFIQMGGGTLGRQEDDMEGLDCNCGLRRGAISATSESLAELEFIRSACHEAQTGNIERLRRTIKANPMAIQSSGDGYTPLLYAARAGHMNVCLLLLGAGAEIEAKTRGGATSLHRAASGGHRDVVQLLVERGADGLIQDSDRDTPTHKAAAAGHGSLAQFLMLTFPASASVTNRHGKTPLMLLNSSLATSTDLSAGRWNDEEHNYQ